MPELFFQVYREMVKAWPPIGVCSVSEAPPDADEDLRPLWIVGLESQKTPIVGDRIRDTGKVDVVDFALFHLFYLVIQPFVQIELNRFNFERLVEFGFDLNAS